MEAGSAGTPRRDSKQQEGKDTQLHQEDLAPQHARVRVTALLNESSRVPFIFELFYAFCLGDHE